MNKTTVVILVLIVVGLGAWFVFGNQTDDRQNNNTQGVSTPPPTPPVSTPTPTPEPTPTPVASNDTEINISSSGFSPASITVKKGTMVTFNNNDTKLRQPASAPHPSHTDYPEFDPKQGIAPADSWSFTFEKVGTWRYHDHLNPTQFGTVIVTE